jgi:hypothetical protein
MEPGNLKVVKDSGSRQNRAPAAIVRIVKSDEKNIPGPVSVSQGLHLDVDAILRRSFPTCPNQHS